MSLILVIFLVNSVFSLKTPKLDWKSSSTYELYEQFKSQYNKIYSTIAENKYRFKVFQANLKRVSMYQSLEQGTAKYGVTKFFDLTDEEFAALYLSEPSTPDPYPSTYIHISKLRAIPTRFDWRDKGAVTPVENQGRCAACWAFSVLGNLESQWFLKHHELIVLSKQFLIDCDTQNNACKGGNTRKALRYMINCGGIPLQDDYPYEDGVRTCKKGIKIKAYLNNTVTLERNERKHAVWLVDNGPLSVSYHGIPLKYYKGGILHLNSSVCPPDNLNHSGVTVGFDVEENEPFWIIKNSWGTNWGEEGYFRFFRGDGTCGVNKKAISAVID